MSRYLKTAAVLLLSLVFSCNGSLSEEQRKALREEMEDREIKKVNENEIFRKALEIGREAATQAEVPTDLHVFSATLRDSLTLEETERKVLMAYAYAPDPTAVEDNIQKQGLDSLIYSTYVFSQEDSVGKVLFVKMARAKVVLEL